MLCMQGKSLEAALDLETLGRLGLDGKWTSLNAPGTETPLPHPYLKLDEFPFPIISPLGL